MTSAGPGTGFSLSYELQPGDLEEMFAADPASRRARWLITSSVASFTLLGAAFTAITTALDRPSIVKDSTGAPSWLYALDILLWGNALLLSRRAWRLRPGWRAQRIWRKETSMHGRLLEEIDSRGVTSTAPDGTQTFIPWVRLVSVRETERAFILRRDTGAPMAVLPKRGLDSPDLIPALRGFLDRSVSDPPPVTGSTERS